jgi:hypothetical protein
MPNPSTAAAIAPKLALIVNLPSTWNEVAVSPLRKDQWPLRLAGPRMIACRAKSVGVRGAPAFEPPRLFGAWQPHPPDGRPAAISSSPGPHFSEISRKSPEKLPLNRSVPASPALLSRLDRLVLRVAALTARVAGEARSNSRSATDCPGARAASRLNTTGAALLHDARCLVQRIKLRACRGAYHHVQQRNARRT